MRAGRTASASSSPVEGEENALIGRSWGWVVCLPEKAARAAPPCTYYMCGKKKKTVTPHIHSILVHIMLVLQYFVVPGRIQTLMSIGCHYVLQFLVVRSNISSAARRVFNEALMCVLVREKKASSLRARQDRSNTSLAIRHNCRLF